MLDWNEGCRQIGKIRGFAIPETLATEAEPVKLNGITFHVDDEFVMKING